MILHLQYPPKLKNYYFFVIIMRIALKNFMIQFSIILNKIITKDIYQDLYMNTKSKGSKFSSDSFKAKCSSNNYFLKLRAKLPD